MKLIIGGAYQGKTAYAQTKYALRDAEIFTCEGEALDLTARCLRHLERFALACVRAGKEPADVLAGLALSYFGWRVCAQADSGRVPLLVFLLLWIYAVFSFSMYAIPLAAQLDLPLRAVFRNALILLLARSGQNVAALLVVAACTLLLVLTAPFLLPLALFAHFSFCALVCLCFAEGGLRRCIAE